MRFSDATLLGFWASRIRRLIAGHIRNRCAEFGTCHRFEDARGDRKAVLAPTFCLGTGQHVMCDQTEMGRGAHCARQVTREIKVLRDDVKGDRKSTRLNSSH